MSVLPSLCAALERAGGDRLVLREGERPHVLAGGERQDVARAALTRAALEAIALEVLSESGRQTLNERGSVIEPLQAPGVSLPLVARAERLDDELYLELRRDAQLQRPAVADPQPAVIDAASAVITPIEPVPAEVDDTHDMIVPAAASDETEVSLDEDDAVSDDASASDYASPPALFGERIEAGPYPAAGPSFAPPISRTIVAATRDPGRQPIPAHTTLAVAPVQETRKPEARIADADAEGPIDFDGWLDRAAALGATVLYLRAGQPPCGRVDDRIEPLGDDVVDETLFERLALDFEHDNAWRAGTDGEWSRDDARLGLITCQPFTDHAGRGYIVHISQPARARRQYRQIPRFVRTACEGDGLVVVAAPTEDEVLAMASTVADWAGQRRGGYVVTLTPGGALRDEIAGAFVSQRELGSGRDAAASIRRAAAELPDVLLVVLSQGGPAMQEVLKAAAGSRTVIVGVVAQTTVSALRLVAAGGTPHADAESRSLLSKTFRGGFSHRTLRRLGGGRTLVQDTLAATAEVGALLAKGDFASLARVQHAGAAGMRSVTHVLAKAVVRRHLTLRQACGHVTDRSLLVALVRAGRVAAAARPSGRRGLVDVSRPSSHDESALYARA